MAINRMCTTLDGIRVALYCKTNAVGVNFTAFAIGSGENLSPENATAMTNEEVRFPVTSVKKVSDGKYRIRGELSNNDFSSDITFRELGLYCEDSEKGGEVLYCYGNAKGADFDYTETLYCFDSTGVVRSRIFEIDIFLDNNVNPTLIIDNSGKADIATVNELIEDVEELQASKADIVTVNELISDVEELQASKANISDISELAGDVCRKSEVYTKTEIDTKIDVNTLINTARTGVDVPQDSDWYLSQWAGGGAMADSDSNKNTVVRRPVSSLFNYILAKLAETTYFKTTSTAVKITTSNGSVKTIYVKQIKNIPLIQTFSIPIPSGSSASGGWIELVYDQDVFQEGGSYQYAVGVPSGYIVGVPIVNTSLKKIRVVEGLKGKSIDITLVSKPL